MDPVVLVASALLGLVVGTCLTVPIWRVPRDEPAGWWPWLCPACRTRLGGRDCIPVVSWLVLRGRCRSCAARIGVRYPGVELLTGGLFLLMVLVLGVGWVLPAYLYLVAVGIALAVIDLDTKRLPNALTLPSYPILAGLLLLPAIVEGAWSGFLRAILGGLALFAFYLVLALVNPAGMGLGDVKLAGVLGMALAWFGWGPWLVGTFLAFLLAAVVGLALMLVGRAGRRTTIPFGPFMLGGALAGIVAGPAIAAWYAGLVAL